MAPYYDVVLSELDESGCSRVDARLLSGGFESLADAASFARRFNIEIEARRDDDGALEEIMAP